MEAGLNIETQSYLTIYRVLDEACFADTAPAGARGAIYRSIDGLRQVGAPAEHVALAERISLLLHKLEWAVRGNDDVEAASLRRELQITGGSWLQTPIRQAMHQG